MTETPEPSVLDSVRAVRAKAMGARPGDPLTVVQATDAAVLAVGGAGLLAVAVLAARRLNRR